MAQLTQMFYFLPQRWHEASPKGRQQLPAAGAEARHARLGGQLPAAREEALPLGRGKQLSAQGEDRALTSWNHDLIHQI